MRIIAGQRRGQKIAGPRGDRTRPTSDLVRESLFNILGATVAGRMVVDLFAGTGAVGLEALSRGAARALFIESHRDNVALIRRNLATLRYEDRARVLAADAYRWARALPPLGDEPVVVFLDPPYRDVEQRRRKVNQLLDQLVRRLPVDSIIAVEASRTLDATVLPDPEAWDRRRYGNTQIALRAVPPGSAPEPLSPPAAEPCDVDS
jgi:16S rRNA (guanine966-N2)-methyltransferase